MPVPPNVATPLEADAVAASDVPANCGGGALAAADELAAAAEDDDAPKEKPECVDELAAPAALDADDAGVAVPNAGALAGAALALALDEAPNENPEDAGAAS